MVGKKTRFLPIIIFSIVFIFSAFNFKQFKELNNKNTVKSGLKFEKEIMIKVPEPSGITFNKTNNSLLIVSDESSRIYKLSLDGKIIDSLEVNGFDLEGITYINDSTLATILERERTVVILTDEGKELSRFDIDLYGKPNSGLEGIAYNSKNNRLYILNEKSPCLLLVLDLTGNVLSKKELKIAKDLSGIFIDESKNEIWITSHESKSVYQCKADGTVINYYPIDIPQVEGIAIDFNSKKIFLVCDKTESLLVYSLP